MNRQNRYFLLLLVTFILPFTIVAQNRVDRPVEITLESPYNTMLVHLHYLQPESYDAQKASQVFYNVEDSTAARNLAIQLKQIFDGEGLYVSLNTIPNDPNFQDSLQRRSIFTPFPEQLPKIYLEKIDERWYYAQESVANIPRIHKIVFPFGTDRLLKLIPQSGQQRFLGLMLWQWLGIVLILLVCFLVYILLSSVLNPIVRRVTNSKLYPSLVPKKLVRRLARLISFFIMVRLMRMLFPILQLPIQINSFIITFLKIVSIILFTFIGLAVVEVLMKYVGKFTRQTESKMDEQLVPIMTRALQGVIITIAILSGLQLLNVNVTALIAGISIGGLAIALAAQDTVKNLFGSFTIFLDRPFQIGDWVNFGGVDGTVEEVGFRSTRVRTFANSLVSVPNGKLADMVINNYGLRVYRRYSTTITITYGTRPELIEQFVEGLRQIVALHPDTRKDAFYVHLNGMSASSLDILFYIFFDVPDWNAELKAKEEILLATLRLAEQLGVEFAYPTTSVHVEKFPGQLSEANTMDKTTAGAKLNNFLEDYKKQFEGR
ncbi:MAG: mechanosensitive ion channel family protein [Bacteroidota bacterium]